jgi:multimeric flavodoxin WrbA
MSTRHVVVLTSSPRKRGNSTILAERVADGAREVGANVECFDLHAMSIRPCDACEFCQGLGTGQCTVNDDMQELYPKLMRADSILLASPIYFFTMSAQMKLCIDRWYALQGTSGNALAGKKIGVVLTYADADPFISGAANALRTYQDIFRYVGAEIIGMVYGTASDPGDVEKQAELMERAYRLGRKLGGEA